MKTIKNLNEEEKMNLILYKLFKREYVGSTLFILLISPIIIVIGMFMVLLPSYLDMTSITTITNTEAFIFTTIILGTLIWLLGIFLIFISIYLIDKKSKKLQVAFQLEHNGCFENIFDISDDDIKGVKRIWKLGGKKNDKK